MRIASASGPERRIKGGPSRVAAGRFARPNPNRFPQFTIYADEKNG